MIRRLVWGISLSIMLLWSASAWAEDLNQGVHGMRWTDHVARFKNLQEVHAKGSAVYYTNKHIEFQLAGTQVTGVIYGFYQDRLFAAFVKLANPLQFSNLHKHFKTRYGDPKTTYSTKAEQTVYRWKTDKITIKLKRKEDADDLKLAIYYTSLSSQLNREQAEQIPEKSFQFLPINKDKRPEAIPLFRF